MNQIRDVQLSIAGFENVRLLNNVDCRTRPLEESDWDETPLLPSPSSSSSISDIVTKLPEITRTQRLFQIEMAKLAQIGSDVLCIFQPRNSSTSSRDYRTTTRISLERVIQDLTFWRDQFPSNEFPPSDSLSWKPDDTWLLLLRATSFRLECIVTRELMRLQGVRNDGNNDSGGSSSNIAKLMRKRLFLTVFELDAIFSRILTYDAVQHFPLGL